MFKSAIILGVLGEVGRLLARSLRSSGIRITGVDLRNELSGGCDEYIQANAVELGTDLQAKVHAAECLFLCLPEEAAMAATQGLAQCLPDGALWVDTLSIKGPITEVLQGQKHRLQILSINPMFAPALGWLGRPVAAVALSKGERAEFLQRLLISWGARIELVTAPEHDEATAVIQVATHAAAIAFGATLLELGCDMHATVRLATPPHRLILALVRRIVEQNPEVYWEIQRDHPLGAATRRALLDVTHRLDENVTTGDRAAFGSMFASIRSLLEKEDSAIGRWSRKFFE
jgi:prephenate dehydrogenase